MSNLLTYIVKNSEYMVVLDKYILHICLTSIVYCVKLSSVMLLMYNFMLMIYDIACREALIGETLNIGDKLLYFRRVF